MVAECVVAEFETLDKAKVGVEVLEKFDFASDAVSLVWRGNEQAMEKLDWESGPEEALGVAKSAGLGGVIVGAVAVPLAVETMIMPVIVTGPLVAFVVGAATGGLLSEAKRWGVQQHRASSYEQRIADGSVLVIVTSTPRRIDEAERGLATTHPKSLERFAYRRADPVSELP
ncbi:MAG: hypothetical protein ACF788_13875 [Novipirellula sp. JB048]